MGKVYESLKEVVKLQRSKNDPVALARVKHTHASSLDEEINLEQKISRSSRLSAKTSRCWRLSLRTQKRPSAVESL
jgi:hypothetical protein